MTTAQQDFGYNIDTDVIVFDAKKEYAGSYKITAAGPNTLTLDNVEYTYREAKGKLACWETNDGTWYLFFNTNYDQAVYNGLFDQWNADFEMVIPRLLQRPTKDDIPTETAALQAMSLLERENSVTGSNDQEGLVLPIETQLQDAAAAANATVSEDKVAVETAAQELDNAWKTFGDDSSAVNGATKSLDKAVAELSNDTATLDATVAAEATSSQEVSSEQTPTQVPTEELLLQAPAEELLLQAPAEVLLLQAPVEDLPTQVSVEAVPSEVALTQDASTQTPVEASTQETDSKEAADLSAVQPQVAAPHTVSQRVSEAVKEAEAVVAAVIERVEAAVGYKA